MSSVKKTKEAQKEPKYIWDSYLSKCVSIYMMVFMTVFILFCKEGYVAYDLHKRNLFYGISLIFIFSTILIILLSLSTNERRPWKELFSKMDMWVVGILVTWGIGWFFSYDRSYAFWGDPYRYIGISYLGLGLLGAWIISRYVKWEIWLTRVFVVVCIIVFVWQTMNCYYIDPRNWTMDQMYHGLMACLANINQNACFNVLVLSVGMVMFILTKEKTDKILLGVFLLLGYVGGISVASATYFTGIGVVFLVLLAYVLRHSEYLWSFWFEAVLFVLSAVIQKVGIYLYTSEDIVLDTIANILMNGKVLLILVVLLAIAALLIWKANTFFEKNGKLLSNIYLLLLGFTTVVVVGGAVYANMNAAKLAEGSLLSKLVINDMSGNARGLIWRVTLGSFARESLVHRIFGCGLNNFSNTVYQYFPQDLMAVWGTDTVLADAHNVFLDILLSSGTVGFICYFGLPVHVFIKCVKVAKNNPVGLYGILGVVAWFAVGMTNANLNVATQVFYVMLGVYWGILRNIDAGEEVNGTVTLV